MTEELKRCPSVEHVVLVANRLTGEEKSARVSYVGDGYDVHSWSERFEEPDATPPDVSRIDVDFAAILYTSGSTGKPKGSC